MLGDVGDPDLVRARGGEVALDEVIVDCWSRRLPGAAAALADGGRPQSLLGAQPPDPPLADVVAGPPELVGQKPVTELWVLAVGVDQRVGQVGVGQLALADRVG